MLWNVKLNKTQAGCELPLETQHVQNARVSFGFAISHLSKRVEIRMPGEWERVAINWTWLLLHKRRVFS